jgi:hypothetical protein
MRNAIIVLLLSATFFFSISCVSGSKYYHIKKEKISDMQIPPEGKARVVFFRPQTGMLGQLFFNIYDADTLIGILPENSFFIYDTEPGEHIFGGQMVKLTDFLKADIAVGKTYYVRCTYHDYFAKYVAKIVAVKKGSDIMSTLGNVLPTLQYATHTNESRKLYKLRDAQSGKYILFRPPMGMVTFRIEFEQRRNEWLEKADSVGKTWLLTEDGL